MPHANLRKRGDNYKVFEVWASRTAKIQSELPWPQTKSYLHAILYDLEAYGDKNQQKDLMAQLTIESIHVLISDTLKREPTHICEKD